jgi:hypothetical protein
LRRRGYCKLNAALDYEPDNVGVNRITAHLIKTLMTAGHFKNRLVIHAT